MSVALRVITKSLAVTASAAAIAAPGQAQAQAANFGVQLTAHTYLSCYVNSILTGGCDVSAEPGASGSVSFGPGSDSSLATTATATSSYESFPTWQHTSGHTVASATSAADLSTASLHLAASGANLTNTGYEAQASDFAKLSDTLHFSVAGATADTETTIGMTLRIQGQLITTGNNANSELYGNFIVGGVGSNFGLQNSTNQTASKTIPNGLSTGLANGSWTSNADYSSNLLTGNYTLKGASADVFTQLQAQLACNTGSGGQSVLCDFSSAGNGLMLSLQLPSNVTYTSDSGVFLSAVPEPQSWALMLAGMAAIASVARRRRENARRAQWAPGALAG